MGFSRLGIVFYNLWFLQRVTSPPCKLSIVIQQCMFDLAVVLPPTKAGGTARAKLLLMEDDGRRVDTDTTDNNVHTEVSINVDVSDIVTLNDTDINYKVLQVYILVVSYYMLVCQCH